VQDIVAFKGKIKLLIYRIKSGQIAAFLALNAFAKEVCNSFALHSSNLSWTPYYISPS